MPKNDEIFDTSQISSKVINNSKDLQSDSAFQGKKQTNDKIFLDFRIGMTKKEYQEKRKELIDRRKLIVSGNQVLYKIVADVYTTEELLDNAVGAVGTNNSAKKYTPPKTSTQYGNVEATFFKDTLIGISIKFNNIKNSSSVWDFFVDKFNTKYALVDEDFGNHSFTSENDTLNLGQSKSYYRKNSWVNGDIKIFLWGNDVVSKVSENKVISKDNIILEYTSTLWSDKKEAKSFIEEKKKENEIENDF